MRKTLAVCVALLIGINAAAQCAEQKSLVIVTGTGEMKVVPDEVSLMISVQNFAGDAATSRADNDRQMKKIIDLIKSLGVDAKDYQTSFIETDPRYKGDNDAKHLLGFFSSSGVSVKLRDISKFNDLKTRALSVGATSVGQIQFSTSQLIEHRAEARKLALHAAKEKAALMAEQLGEKIGKAFTITELLDSNNFNRAFSYNAVQAQAGVVPNDGTGNMAEGVIAITERVSVSFLLEQSK